ncbi:MAG: ABC transporter permease [Paraprevotella sp.]|nr:ABC transporter permease [Paraprevotella sp.]
MNIQFKNFSHLLRRYPLPILGNVLGLAVALTVFLIISMEVTYNNGYDRQIKDVDRLYLLTVRLNDEYDTHCTRPLCESVTSYSPHIETATFRQWYQTEAINVQLNDMDMKMFFIGVADNYFDTFGFDWLACDTTALNDPWALFLSESMALRVYGTTDLVRKPANFSTESGWYIGGVYRDSPENSSLINGIYHNLGDENKGNTQNGNYRCYLKLTDPERRADVEEAIRNAQGISDTTITINLIPYADLHFRPEIPSDKISVTVSPESQYLFLFISLVIIVIACINFTNLYAALCPLRIRNINTRKVLGATRGELFRTLTAETTLVGLGAGLLALCLTVLAERAGLGELQHAAISLTAHPALTGFSLVLALLMGFASGIYPALYATSFQPALVLKGNFGLSPRGRSLRNMLIGVQFVTAFGLLIGVLNVWQQNDYMRHSELGYNQNRLINISTQDIRQTEGGIGAFMDGLKQLAVVEDAALADDRLSSVETGQMSWGRRIDNLPDDNNRIYFHCLPVSYNFLRTAGITVTQGRDFAATDMGSYIFNEAAMRKFENLRLGTTLGEEAVVGVCADFKFGDIHDEVEPMAFKLMNTPPYQHWGWQNYIVVRVREGITLDEALETIRDYARPVAPDRDIEVLSQFDVMDITYAEDAKQLKSLLLFCALAVFICLTSVFGLVVFECEYRRKEIGIRKVLGAVTGGIIAMLCRKYFWILSISFAIAAPLALYTVDTWLQNFAYRTEILPWTFLVPLAAVAVVTFLTVAIQSYRTANANPMDSLRTE